MKMLHLATAQIACCVGTLAVHVHSLRVPPCLRPARYASRSIFLFETTRT